MKITKTNQGMVNPIVIVLVVVVLAAVGFAGWKVMSNNKDNKNSTTTGSSANTVNNVAVASACEKAVSDANICNFASHYNPNAAYKATDTSNTSDGAAILTISSDGEGNYEITGTSNGTTFDSISLNGATYLKDASSGTWIKYSASSASTTSNPANDLKISTSDITGNGTITYKNLGTVACGSDTCYKYQIVDTTQTGSTQYVWFDNKNYQLHEYYVQNSDGTNDMTFDYQGVNITAPSPVTDYLVPSQ